MEPEAAETRGDLPSFVETAAFSSSWKQMGLSDEDLVSLQKAILANPRAFPVVRGTGGLRKMRFASAGSAQGKSGQLRVVYVYFTRHGLILLVNAYKKSKKVDLTASERKAVRALVTQIEAELSRRET